MTDRITQEQLDDLTWRADEVCKALPGDWYVGVSPRQPSDYEVRVDYEFPDVPEVKGIAKYLADHYVTGPDIPGVAKFRTHEGAVEFIGLIYGFALQEWDVDYNKVLDMASMVVREAWRDTASALVEDAGYDDLPCEGDGVPYWLEEMSREFDGAWITATAAEDWTYSSHPAHFPENGGLLIATIHGFMHSEAEVELGYYYDQLNELEGALLQQLFCTTHKGQYAYVQVSVNGALFLEPVAENAGYLEQAVKSQAFQDEYARDEYVYQGPVRDRQQEEVDEWCEKAGLPRWDIDTGAQAWYDKIGYEEGL